MTKEQLRALGGKFQEAINESGATPDEALNIFLAACQGQADELGLSPRQLFARATHLWDGNLVRREKTIHFPNGGVPLVRPK